MSFVINPGTVVSPLTAGGIAYGTGSQVKVNSAGTAGQVLLSNGASTPTWGTVASGATVTAVASGSIATGQTVIMQSDGTVKIATQIASTTQTSGTANNFVSTYSNARAACYDSVNKKVIVVISDNTANISGYVGTISGTSITFGSANVFTTADYVDYITIVFDPIKTKLLIVYYRSGFGYSQGVVGTVSGTTITYGATTANNQLIPNQICYDTASGNILVTGYSSVNTLAYCFVASIGVSSLTFGTPVALNANASNTYYQACCYDSNNSTSVVFYTVSNGGGGYNLFARTATISGTNVTLGTETNIDTNGGKFMSAVYDPINNKSLITYLLIGYNYLSCRVITATGSSISSGSRVDIVPNGYVNTWAWSTVDPSTGYISIIWSQYTSTIGVFTVVGNISGTTFTFGSSVRQNTIANINGIANVYDENTKKVANFYYNTTNFSTALITNFYATNITATNFLGFSAATYTNGQTATINVISSTDNNQTSLTPGNGYYVQNDGTLSTTAASPSVYAGLALTSTKILVKG